MNHFLMSPSIERKCRLKFQGQADTEIGQKCENLESFVDPISKKEELLFALKFSKTIPYFHVGLSSEAYLSHPMKVAWLSMSHVPLNIIAMGKLSLHQNVLEVSKVSQQELSQAFDPELVALTVDREQQWDPSYKRKYYGNIGSFGHELVAVKVCEKLDNLFTLGLNPDSSTREKYLAEISDSAMPLVRQYAKHFCNLANAEVFRRIFTTLRLNIEGKNRAWNHVLKIQINHLLESEALFGGLK